MVRQPSRSIFARIESVASRFQSLRFLAMTSSMFFLNRRALTVAVSKSTSAYPAWPIIPM